MRKDYVDAVTKDVGPIEAKEPHIAEREKLVPAGSKVLHSLNSGRLLLLDNGLLEIMPKILNFKKTTGSNFYGFSDLSTVSLQNTSVESLTVIKIEKSRTQVVAGSTPRLDGIRVQGDTELVKAFHDTLLELMQGGSSKTSPPVNALDKIATLKTLLESGALTQSEFDSAKAKILESL